MNEGLNDGFTVDFDGKTVGLADGLFGVVDGLVVDLEGIVVDGLVEGIAVGIFLTVGIIDGVELRA